MTRKRTLHHPVLHQKFGKYELWEGGGPTRKHWIIKVPGGWMNLQHKVKCLRYIKQELSDGTVRV